MTQILPYVFGTFSLFIGIYIFSLTFKLNNSNHKTIEDNKKEKKWYVKYRGIMILISILLIANGAYDLILGDPERYRIGSPKKTLWEKEDKDLMVQNCMRDANSTATKYPIITRGYCNCSTEEITKKMSYQEYVNSLEMTVNERLKIIMPLIQDCVARLNQKIKKEKEKD